MDIQSWFDSAGSFSDGVMLYSQLPSCSKSMLRTFSKENASNFLKLKYELKKAVLSGSDVAIEKQPLISQPATEHKPTSPKPDLKKLIIQESEQVNFKKETMASYPMELHGVYRERIHNFYQACELKFQLNALPADAEEEALAIILQLEDLWTRIDKAWTILDHWKDHNRIMPTKESEDFKKLSPVKMVMKRNNLESRISKRQKTIEKMEIACSNAPEDRAALNLLNRKKEQFQQLVIDLETVRNYLKDESNPKPT